MKPQSRREFAPVIDEAAFEQLLSAAFVMQEHNSRLKQPPKSAASAAAPLIEAPPVVVPQPVPSRFPDPVPSITTSGTKNCNECGLAIGEDQFFCQNCGAPAERTQKATQKNWASLWDMHQSTVAEPEPEQISLSNSAALDSTPISDEEVVLFPAELTEIVGAYPETEADQEPEEPSASRSAQGLTRVAAGMPSQPTDADQAAVQHPYPWTSAAKARAWLDSLKAQQPSGDWFKEEWNIHRGAIYIALAAAVLLAVVFQSSARPASDPTQPRELTGFERVLISLGLAEAPPPPALAAPGNPKTKVWVDVHTALYYCPGADLYGKTPEGRYATQLEAQRDNFQPSTLKACD